MSDGHERTADLLEAYALDALEPDERQSVSDHLDEGCEDCEETVSALRRVAAALALVAPIVIPRPRLKERVLAEAHGGGASGRRGPPALMGFLGRRAGLAALAASVAVATVAGLATWNVLLHDRVDELETSNQGLVSGVASVAAAPAARANADADALIALSARETQVFPLAQTQAAPRASGRMIWDPQAEEITLVASGLEPTEGGSAYVVWMETSGGFQKVGVFYVDATGRGILHGYLPARLDSTGRVIVTHEPSAAASQQPSEFILLLSR